MLKQTSRVLMALFIVLGIIFGIRGFMQGNVGRGLLGLGSIAFLVIPKLMAWVHIKMPYAFYCQLLAFLIIAYDIGCVYQAFDAIPHYDKVSHFLSGFVFTSMGYCLFLYLGKNRLNSIDDSWVLGITYALFFSVFVAVMWEVCEFTGFVLTGHDSQHTLDTGVFDTMYDLICCLGGSVLCISSCILYFKKHIKLYTGTILEEFYVLNVAGK